MQKIAGRITTRYLRKSRRLTAFGALSLLWLASCKGVEAPAPSAGSPSEVETLVEAVISDGDSLDSVGSSVRVDTEDLDSEADLATRLEPLLLMARKAEASEPERQVLFEHLEGDEPALRAAATLVLYRLEPDAYWDRMIDWFGAHDYLARSFGRKIVTTKAQCAQVVADIVESYGGEQQGGILLLAFLHFQNTNQWVPNDKGSRSVARYFRQTFLEAVMGGREASMLSERIDQAAILRARTSGKR